MHRIVLVVFALFLTVSFTQEASAQVYKYVDKDGVVHFTATPTDPKYKNPNSSTSSSSEYENLDARNEKFQRLIKRIMDELENPKRGSENKDLCARAIEILQEGMQKQSSYDEEFLSTIERAIFNGKTNYYPNGQSYISYYNRETEALLAKARLMKSIPESQEFRNQKMKRDIEKIKRDLPSR